MSSPIEGRASGANLKGPGGQISAADLRVCSVSCFLQSYEAPSTFEAVAGNEYRSTRVVEPISDRAGPKPLNLGGAGHDLSPGAHPASTGHPAKRRGRERARIGSPGDREAWKSAECTWSQACDSPKAPSEIGGLRPPSLDDGPRSPTSPESRSGGGSESRLVRWRRRSTTRPSEPDR